MSGLSRALKSAKSVLRKIPGSGSIERFLEKAKSKPMDLDVNKVPSLYEAEIQVNRITEYTPVQMTPEDVKEICDISRLRDHHRCKVNGQMPPLSERISPLPKHMTPLRKLDFADSLGFNRRLYARYGAATSIDPRKLWPSESELETDKEVAALRYPITVDDILKRIAELKAAEAENQAAIRARDEEVAAKIPVMEAMKEKIYTDAIKLEQELNVAEEKRNKRIEQVRSYFQYTLDVKDPRFKEKMVEMIQSEKDAQKKKSKEAKKQKKEEMKAQRDAEKAAAIKARREAKAKADAESSDDE